MQKIDMEFGEKRMGTESSIRVWFTVITPTGAEVPIIRMSHLKRTWSTKEEDGRGNRTIRIGYEVIHDVTLKLITIRSQFGKPNSIYEVYLDLDENAEKFQITGIEEFGKLVARGRLNKTKTKLNVAELKSILGFEIIAAPIKDGEDGLTRALMY